MTTSFVTVEREQMRNKSAIALRHKKAQLLPYVLNTTHTHTHTHTHTLDLVGCRGDQREGWQQWHSIICSLKFHYIVTKVALASNNIPPNQMSTNLTTRLKMTIYRTHKGNAKMVYQCEYRVNVMSKGKYER